MCALLLVVCRRVLGWAFHFVETVFVTFRLYDIVVSLRPYQVSTSRDESYATSVSPGHSHADLSRTARGVSRLNWDVQYIQQVVSIYSYKNGLGRGTRGPNVTPTAGQHNTKNNDWYYFEGGSS